MTGRITNQGTIKDVTFVGQSLKGGYLAGDITINSDTNAGLGLLENITLRPHTKLKGGLFLTGFVTAGQADSHADNKALIEKASIQKGTELSYVIIGKDCRVAKGVKIGAGVRFVSNDLIPEEADLTVALLKPFAENSPAAIDMSTDIVTNDNAPSLLSQVNEIAILNDNDWQLTQNDNGQLQLTITDINYDINYALTPERVKQAKANQAKLTLNRDGSATFVTKPGREITGQPVIQNPSALEEAVAPLDIKDVRWQKNGLLTAKLKEGRVVARADMAAKRVSDDEPVGLFEAEGSASKRLVFVDKNGQKREQLIHPFCADPEALHDHQANVQEETDLELAHNGTVSFTIEGKRYHGIFDYVVHPSKEGDRSEKGELDITPIVEEGKTVGFTVTYPTGETQRLWLMGDANP